MINVAGSINLLMASSEAVKTFIYCSSVSAVGEFLRDDPIDVDYPLRPTSDLRLLESGDGHGAARLVAARSARSLFAAFYEHLWAGPEHAICR